MKFEIGYDGKLYVIFRDEYEVEQNEHRFNWLYHACFNGYMNALCLQDSTEP